MTLKNNRAPLLNNIKLCATFHHHMWIQTGVMVRKWLNWVLTSVTWTFDLWPWPFAWTSLLSLVITPENFMMIRWWEHGEKGVTDRQTDWTIHGAAWSQLKMQRGVMRLSGKKNCYSYLVPERQTKLCMVCPYRYDFGMVLRLIQRGCLIILCDSTFPWNG